MRNLKKLLAVITVVALMATLFVIPASAAGLSDIADTQYESAISRLNALGIITGREDGKFYPDDTITRAEFAAVVIRSLGYGDAAAAAQGQTKYTDVTAGFWATGYINLATSLGIIKGRPDGTFAPNDKVLYEEAVTMVVRSLGYEPAAVANGGYPTGYLVVAAQEGVTDDAAGVAGMQASRALVAKMVDNALEVEMMGQVAYGTEIKFEKNGKTLLTDFLKLKEYEATVESVDAAEMEIKVELADIDSYGDKGGSNQTYDVFETLNVNGLKGAVVTIWVKEISNADDMIYNIKLNSTILYDYITEVNGEDDAAVLSGDDIDADEADNFTFKNVDNDYDLAVGFTATLNTNNATSNRAEYLLDTFAKVILVEGNIKSIEAYSLVEGGLITAIDDSDITYTKQDTKGKKVRALDDADSLMVVLDGEIATAADLDVDMLFDVWTSADGEEIVISASSMKAEGSLDKVYTDKVYVDGTKIDLDNDYANKYYSKNDGTKYEVWAEGDVGEALIGTDVVGYKAPKGGKIRYLKGAGSTTTTEFWGVITKAYETDEEYLQDRKSVV